MHINNIFCLFVLILLINVHSAANCNTGFFECKDQSECIDESKVCNFEYECPDKSDEEMCGTCDFETSMCGYYDKSDKKFSWTRIQEPSLNPNPGEGPLTDHTFLKDPTKKGHFVTTQYNPNESGYKTHLWGPIMGSTSSFCKLNLWAYLMHPRSLLNIYFTDSRDTSEIKLLKAFYGDGFPTWKFYSFDVGAFPAKYQLEFNAYPYIDNQTYSDIALDDIEFVECSSNLNIQFDKSLDCHFDEGLCSYTNDPTGVMQWKLAANETTSSSGPAFDHTTGYGYYAIMIISYSHINGKPGRLLSSIQTQRSNEEVCFDFWYLMFGATINRLDLYLDEFDPITQNYTVFDRTLIWRRQRSQGRKWFNYKTTIKSSKHWRVTFEGLSGTSVWSDLALDDLSLTQGRCPPSKTCDFESGNLCEFKNVNDQTAELDWNVGRAYADSIDHTTFTNFGEFAYVNGAGQPATSKARMQSIDYPTDGIECAQFWYMFETNDRVQAMELNVYQKVGSDYGTPKWSKHSQTDDRSWSFGQIEIDPTTSNYSIVFEALKRTAAIDERLIVGLDDVVIVNGECMSPVNCGFEGDSLCSWKQYDLNDIDWLLNQGLTDTSETGPHVDVTLGTEEGYYAYIETSPPTKPGDSAILVSEYIDPTIITRSSACFGLWYFMYGEDVGELSVWLNDTQLGMRLLENITGEQGFEWFPLRININNNNEFRIAIKGVAGKGSKGDIAIDELSYTTNPCPGYTTQYVSTTPFDHNIECTFDSNTLCGWIHDPTSMFTWKLLNGPTPTPLTGPPNDHTTQSNTGYYIYMSATAASVRQNNATARIASNLLPVGSTGGGACFSFFYHMFGSDIGRLAVYHELTNTDEFPGEYGRPVWQKFGNHGNHWRHVQVFMQGSLVDQMRIIIEGVTPRNDGPYGDIAIDDVMFHLGACPVNDYCDFESQDFCGYRIENSADDDDDDETGLTWSRERSNDDDAPDHTIGNSLGHYMIASSESPHVKGRTTRLFASREYNESVVCARFWYKIIGHVEFNVLAVSLNDSETLFSAKIERGYQWALGQASISSLEPFEVAFEVVDKGSGYDGHVLLDDVNIILNKQCEPLLHCDFESGDTCGYHELTKISDFSWVMLTGALGLTQNDLDVPKVDHTLGTADGSFLYLDTQNRKEGERSVIESEIVPEFSGVLCFHFYLSMSENNKAKLQIVRKDVNFPDVIDVLFLENQSLGNGWREQMFELEDTNYPYTILIEGIATSQDPSVNKAHLAIDDISLTYGKCDSIVLTTTSSSVPSSNIGLILGIVIPVIVIITLAGFGVFYLYRTKKGLKWIKFGNKDSRYIGDMESITPSYTVDKSGN